MDAADGQKPYPGIIQRGRDNNEDFQNGEGSWGGAVIPPNLLGGYTDPLGLPGWPGT
jgi:hypothetical protein